MNIGMVLHTRFPPDIRVEKEARSLIAAGHGVYLLTPPLSGRPEREEIDGITVQRTTAMMSTIPVARELNSLKFYLSFRNDVWRKEIAKFVDDSKIDVLHIHDLPLVGTGITVARAKGIPIVADLHENYPAALQVWRGLNRGLKQKIVDDLFNGLDRWVAYEKRCVQEADRVIVVVDEAKERLLRYGVPDEKVTVLMNVEDVDSFSNIELDPGILAQYKEQKRFIVSYVGGFGPHRGLDTAIKAISLARERVPSIKLLLIGAQKGDYSVVLQKIIKKFQVEDLVEITGWQPFEKVPSYIQASDVCLVPHHRSPHTDNTIPHKLFQYMLMGKPVIVSDCRPLKRIVEETQGGLVFQAGNAKDLANKIIALYDSRELRERCGKQGRRYVFERYNWKQESRKLIALYQRLL